MKNFVHDLFTTSDDYRSVIPRLIVGLVFLSEGIQKFLFPALGVLRFEKIGFMHPAFLSSFTGTFEIVCGIMVLVGLFTRLAAIPLFIVIMTAIGSTKIPILTEQGFWAMAHEARTDFAIFLLIIFLFIYGAGRGSADYFFIKRKNNRI
jgi:uncharacterized membrane protein YphA (DoxX/SURF4 family)